MAWELVQKLTIGGAKYEWAIPAHIASTAISVLNNDSGTTINGDTQYNYNMAPYPIQAEWTNYNTFYPPVPRTEYTLSYGTIAFGQGSNNRYVIALYDNVGAINNQYGTDYNTNSNGRGVFFFAVDHENKIADLLTSKSAYYLSSDRNKIHVSIHITSKKPSERTRLYNLLVGAIPPTFNLHSIKEVSGLNSTLHLTKLRDDMLNEGQQTISPDRSVLEEFDTRSLFRNIFAGDNEIITTYHDGNDYMRLSSEHNNGNIYLKCEYKIGDSYSLFRLDVGVNSMERNYLAILVDDENEIAVTSTIDIPPAGTEVGYNYHTLDQLGQPTLAHIFWLILHGKPLPSDENDPYGDIPDSTPDGGDGDHNYIDQEDPMTELPENIIGDLGFVKYFAPTQSQINQLANFMWSNDIFTVESFKKLFSEPMDCILGIMVFPYRVPATGLKTLVIGNIATDVQMAELSDEFEDIDCGSVYIEQQLASFLDYSPYTKLSVYLPFCGTYELDSDKCVGKWVYLTYRVNYVTGACVAILEVEIDDDPKTKKSYRSVIGQFSGNMAYTVPITSASYSNALNSIINTASGVVRGALNRGGTGALTAGISGLASFVTSMKPSIETSGSVTGALGACSKLTPHFIFTCPRLVNPQGKNQIVGTPSYVTKKVNECSGFVQAQDLHFSSSRAMHSEIEEIERLLKEGIIV